MSTATDSTAFASFGCPKCSQPFEIPLDYSGDFVTCPHCDHSITVERANAKLEPKKPFPAKGQPFSNPVLESGKKPLKPKIGSAGVFVCAVIGVILILNGCLSTQETSIHQVYCAIQYCSGWILIGIALLIEAVVQVGNKFD